MMDEVLKQELGRKLSRLKELILNSKGEVLHQYTPYTFDFRGYEITGDCVLAYINIALAIVYIDYEITSVDCFVGETLTSKTFEVFMNKVKDIAEEELFLSHQNKICKPVIQDLLGDIASAFSDYINFLGYFFSMDLNLYGILDAMENDEEVFDIIDKPHFNDQMTVQELSDKRKSLYKTIESKRIEPFSEFGIIGEAVRPESAMNILIGIGARPAVEDDTRMVNFVIPDKWINGIQSRKIDHEETGIAVRALTVQKTSITETGTFNKQCNVLSTDAYLRNDDAMCDSVHTIATAINTKEDLIHYDTRYISENGNVVKLLKTDDFRIGTVVNMRSPITCNSKNGICKYCFQEKYLEYSKSTERHNIVIGGYAITYTVSAAGQLLLQAKHNTKPSPAPNIITVFQLKDHLEIKLSEKEQSDLYALHYDNLIFSNSIDEILIDVPSSMDKDRMYMRESLSIIVRAGGVTYKLVSNTPFVLEDTLSLTTEMLGTIVTIKDKRVKIALRNEPLTQLFTSLKKILHMTDVDKDKMTIKDLLDWVNRVIPNEESILKELLIRNLIRSANDTFVRPDWSDPYARYKAVGVISALIKYPELSASVGEGHIKSKFKHPRYYSTDMLRNNFDILFENTDKKGEDGTNAESDS